MRPSEALKVVGSIAVISAIASFCFSEASRKEISDRLGQCCVGCKRSKSDGATIRFHHLIPDFYLKENAPELRNNSMVGVPLCEDCHKIADASLLPLFGIQVKKNPYKRGGTHNQS